MDIQIVQGHRPPPNPDGITVIIDVIRAFTTSFHAFLNGARAIYPVPSPAAAFALRQQVPDALLAGEIQALPIDGFDFGNSPWEVSQAPLQGRALILRTTNGVEATLHARPCQALYVAGLVNADATVAAIRARSPRRVLLVASHPTGDEDVACAEYMAAALGGDGIDAAEAVRRTREARAARKFLDGSHPRLRPEDIRMAATLWSGSEPAFAMRVQDDARLTILPEYPPAH